MRAKLINEKFVKNSDPIRDMKIGIKCWEDYVEKQLDKNGLDIQDFYDYRIDFIQQIYSKTDLIEIIDEYLSKTPVKYQISQIKDILADFLEHNDIEEDKE